MPIDPDQTPPTRAVTPPRVPDTALPRAPERIAPIAPLAARPGCKEGCRCPCGASPMRSPEQHGEGPTAPDAPRRTRLAISGMRSNACRERILASLIRIDGVQEANVSLIRASADIVHLAGCDLALMARTVAALGFGVTLEAAIDHLPHAPPIPPAAPQT